MDSTLRVLKAAQEGQLRSGGGRGLLLVREIAREGGVCDVEHTVSGGKGIWAALPLKATRVLPAH